MSNWMKTKLIILLFVIVIVLSACNEYEKISEEAPLRNTSQVQKQIILDSRNITDDNNTALSMNRPIENNISGLFSTSPPEENTSQTNLSVNGSNPVSNDSKPDSWYKPKPGITWQWQLSGTINTGYDVDLYDIDLEETPKKTIEKLHNKGVKVICYFNAGAYEPYRSDSEQFPKSSLGRIMEGWEDERWLDISNYQEFSNIMLARLDMAVEKGCDGVEPDNIHGYQENTGFHLTYDDQLRYNKWLAGEAHKRNLAIALKNDGEQAKDLVDHFDFAVVEECFQYDECDPYNEFIRKDKAVLGVEYELPKRDFCDEADRRNFSWLKMDLDLDGSRTSCD